MPKFLKGVLYLISAIFAALTAYAAFESPDGAWPLCVMAIAFLISANFDQLAEFSATTSGVRAVMRNAEQKIDELDRVVRLVASAGLALIQRSGRIGGFPDDEKEKFLEETMSLLKSAGISDQEIEDIRRETWDKYVMFDYVLAATGGSLVPSIDDADLKAQWGELRNIRNMPTPDEIEAFLEKAGGLHGLRKDLVEEYRYYCEHKRHRNPEIYRRRNDVKQIPN